MNAETRDFEEIAPYPDSAFAEAIERLWHSPASEALTSLHSPGIHRDSLDALVKSIDGVAVFQERIIGPTIESMLAASSAGATLLGTEALDPSKRYLFLSNHREIVLDPALFTQRMWKCGHPTPMICLGDNLLTQPWVVDLMKMNKGITVKRNLSPRELMRWSLVLSKYVRKQIRENLESVWIAQSEGRAKDCDDRTHPGVLKMLALSGEGSLVEALQDLHIVPVAVSYEYDPCDVLKARELFLFRARGSYAKAPGEDIRSMREEIRGYKGHIEIKITPELTGVFAEAARSKNRREQLLILTTFIDRALHLGYHNWPSNYAAYELLHGERIGEEKLPSPKRAEFVARLNERLELIPSEERAGVQKLVLEMYARPVENAAKAA